MKSKRVFAKIIDLIIYLFISGIFCGFVYVGADAIIKSYDIIDTMAQFMTELSTLNAEAAFEYISANQEVYFVFMTLTFIGMLLFGVVYFGVIGYFVNGSLGKYVLKIGVKNVNSDKKVNMLILSVREPFMQLQAISFTLFLISYFFPSIPLINIFQLLYIIMFIMNRDFWNKIFNVKVDTL